MFDAERILGHMIRGSLGGALKGGSSAGLGLGLLGVAMAAFEHYQESSSQQAPPAGSPPPVPPPLPTSPSSPPRAAGPTASPPPLPVSGSAVSPPVPATSPASSSGPPSPPPIPATRVTETPASSSGNSVSSSSDIHSATRSSTEPAVLLIRAMITAGHADGELDAKERDAILEAANNAGLSAEEMEFLRNELDHPRSMREIVDHASTPEMRHQIYLASRMAISVDTEAEKRYLQALSVALYLTADEVAQIEAQWGE